MIRLSVRITWRTLPPRLRASAALLAAALLLSGCAYAGLLLGWSGSGAALLAALTLAGCGVPAVENGKLPANPFTAGGPAPVHDVGNLATGDGTEGFIVQGASPDEGAGTSVSLGDFNGDGFADVALGSPYFSGGYGAAFVVLGHAPPFPPVLNTVVSLAPPVGARFFSPYANAYAGTAVAFVGSVNGDGFEDLAIGSPSLGPNSGTVSVVMGSSPPQTNLYLDNTYLTGPNGTTFFPYNTLPYYAMQFGATLANGGDLNGDGLSDILMGAPNFGSYSYATPYVVGRFYETFGSTIFGANTYLDPITPTLDTTIYGPLYQNAFLGTALAGGGNVDGDPLGMADVLVGATGSYLAPAHAFVHFNPGTTAGTFGSIQAGTLATFNFSAICTTDVTGHAVAMADMDHDGYADLIIGNPRGSRTLTSPTSNDIGVGRIHVVFGGPALVGGFMNELSLNGSNGFTLIGTESYESAGYALAAAGDVNGDGYDDILIGAADYTELGPSGIKFKVYVVFGGPRPGTSEIHLSQLTASQGLVIKGIDFGPYSYYNGLALAGGRDVDGDGIPDVVIGSNFADNYYGQVYVIFGSALRN